jgi:hypothetical protein
MIESDMWKIKETMYRKAIVDRDNEIYRLKQEIETLKNKQKVYSGFHVKCSETILDLALPRNRKYTGTHD